MAGDLVVAITGASGSPYGVRLLDVLLRAGHTVHLVISPAATQVMERELGVAIDLNRFDPTLLLKKTEVSRLHYHHFRDFSAGIASGSFRTAGMAVCPCSMGTAASRHRIGWPGLRRGTFTPSCRSRMTVDRRVRQSRNTRKTVAIADRTAGSPVHR